LVGCGEPVIRTNFTEGTVLDAGRSLHQELVNDNYSCSSSGDCCSSACLPCGRTLMANVFIEVAEDSGDRPARKSLSRHHDKCLFLRAVKYVFSRFSPWEPLRRSRSREEMSISLEPSFVSEHPSQ
jgi:hypothetical protein